MLQFSENICDEYIQKLYSLNNAGYVRYLNARYEKYLVYARLSSHA